MISQSHAEYAAKDAPTTTMTATTQPLLWGEGGVPPSSFGSSPSLQSGCGVSATIEDSATTRIT